MQRPNYARLPTRTYMNTWMTITNARLHTNTGHDLALGSSMTSPLIHALPMPLIGRHPCSVAFVAVPSSQPCHIPALVHAASPTFSSNAPAVAEQKIGTTESRMSITWENRIPLDATNRHHLTGKTSAQAEPSSMVHLHLDDYGPEDHGLDNYGWVILGHPPPINVPRALLHASNHAPLMSMPM